MGIESVTAKNPAFPVYGKAEGMTLRDYFAAKALQGFCTNAQLMKIPDEVVGAAYEIADAMLIEREKHP